MGRTACTESQCLYKGCTFYSVETVASIVDDVMNVFLTLFRVGTGENQKHSHAAVYRLTL